MLQDNISKVGLSILEEFIIICSTGGWCPFQSGTIFPSISDLSIPISQIHPSQIDPYYTVHQ